MNEAVLFKIAQRFAEGGAMYAEFRRESGFSGKHMSWEESTIQNLLFYCLCDDLKAALEAFTSNALLVEYLHDKPMLTSDPLP